MDGIFAITRPGKTAREAVDEAMEHFEGDTLAHVIDPDGQEITIDLLV